MEEKIIKNKIFRLFVSFIDVLAIGIGVLALLTIIITSYFWDYHNYEVLIAILTSVVASSIFYTFNILIPRISKVINMVKYLEIELKEISMYSDIILENLKLADGNIKTFEDYFFKRNEVDKELNDKLDLIASKDPDFLKHITKINYHQKIIFDKITMNFSNLLANTILFKINELNIYFSELNLAVENDKILNNSLINSKSKNDRILIFKSIIILMVIIKYYYEIK